jgi:hypothetical protein
MQFYEIDLWRQRREDMAREAEMERLARSIRGLNGPGDRGILGRVRALFPAAPRADRPESDCA